MTLASALPSVPFSLTKLAPGPGTVADCSAFYQPTTTRRRPGGRLLVSSMPMAHGRHYMYYQLPVADPEQSVFPDALVQVRFTSPLARR
jgi:hypothetical protein